MCFCLNSLTGSMLIKICMFYALPVLVLSGPPPATCVLAPSQVNRQRTVQSPKYKCSIPPTDEKSSIQDAQYKSNSENYTAC